VRGLNGEAALANTRLGGALQAWAGARPCAEDGGKTGKSGGHADWRAGQGGKGKAGSQATRGRMPPQPAGALQKNNRGNTSPVTVEMRPLVTVGAEVRREVAAATTLPDRNQTAGRVHRRLQLTIARPRLGKDLSYLSPSTIDEHGVVVAGVH
jgi:hypothetical protein